MVKRDGMADEIAEAIEDWRGYFNRVDTAIERSPRSGQPLQASPGLADDPGLNRGRPFQDGKEDYDGVARQAGDADSDRIAAEWADLIGKAKRAQKGYRLKPALRLKAFVTNLIASGL